MTIFFSEHFKKQLKRLKKKFPHIKEDLLKIIDSFKPAQNIHIGKSIYKIRIPASDMQKGKSSGFRSYMFLYIKKDMLVPLCIYAKSETENITENELEYHFNQAFEEIINTYT